MEQFLSLMVRQPLIFPEKVVAGVCFQSSTPSQVPNCAEAGVIGALPGLVGSIQAIEAVKIIMGVGNVLSSRMF